MAAECLVSDDRSAGRLIGGVCSPGDRLVVSGAAGGLSFGSIRSALHCFTISMKLGRLGVSGGLGRWPVLAADRF